MIDQLIVKADCARLVKLIRRTCWKGSGYEKIANNHPPSSTQYHTYPSPESFNYRKRLGPFLLTLTSNTNGSTCCRCASGTKCCSDAGISIDMLWSKDIPRTRPVNHLLKTRGRRSLQSLARASVLRVIIHLQLVVTWSLRWVILQILPYCSPDHELTMWVSQLRLLVPSALCCSSPLPLKTWLEVDEEPTVRNTGASELWEAQLNKIPRGGKVCRSYSSFYSFSVGGLYASGCIPAVARRRVITASRSFNKRLFISLVYCCKCSVV